MKIFARNHYFFILLTTLLVMSSCVKEMDFEGAKDITFEPQMKIEVAKAEISTQEIIDKIDERIPDGTPDPVVDQIYKEKFGPLEQSADVDISSLDTAMEYLESATLNFNFINSTPRDITITVRMYKKGNNTPIETFTEPLPKSNNDTITVISEFGKGTEIENLKKLAKLEIDITVEGGADLRTDPTGKFELNTVGIFNFSYDPSQGLP